jgi:multiple sugar transport system permease protein
MLFAATAAHGFARIRFPGNEVLSCLVIILMVIPGALVLTPSFILASRIGLRNSLTGLGIFHIAGELRCLWHIGSRCPYRC